MASQQHQPTTPPSPATDTALLMEMVAMIRDLNTEVQSLRSDVSSMSAKLESLEAGFNSAPPTLWTPPTSTSSTLSALSAPSTPQSIQTIIQPVMEWDPEVIGYFHGYGDDVHAFVDRLFIMAPLIGVKVIQANFVMLLKDTALNWYYLELPQDTRTAFNNHLSLDLCCEALIKRFVPSCSQLLTQLDTCHYTRKDAAKKKDAINYIHSILRISKGLGWSHETSIAIAFARFEAHLRVNLDPNNCTLSQFIKQVQQRQSCWNEIYAGFGQPSPSSKPKLHQQPSRSQQFDQPQQQPHEHHQQQQYRPQVRTTQQDHCFNDDEDWGYDPPTDSYYVAPTHAPAHAPHLYGGQPAYDSGNKAMAFWDSAEEDYRCSQYKRTDYH